MSNSMNVIQHNMSAVFTDRQLGITTNTKAKSSEKLSSGYRINRAADDAAGLSMSEKMRRQIRGLTQASKNMQDAVSLAQVADGYLAEVHDMIQRVNELCVKGANGTLHTIDREYIDNEVQDLKDEMARIFGTANFNEIPLFHVPYTPEVRPVPEASDFGVFHLGNSTKPGGLEFNNVRYNIKELQELGMKIDNNGVALENIEDFTFDLWDEERVSLSLTKGQDLNSVTRNYTWEGKDDGIYINNKLAVTWENITFNGTQGLGNTDTFEPGVYSFTYHGTEISFQIDQQSPKREVMTGITGDEATKAASWDISAGTVTERKAASITNGNTSQVVTPDNKAYIDHDFYVTATAEGLTISHQPATGSRPGLTGGDTASVTGDIVKWDTFRDSSKASGVIDDSGEEVETNTGYPIVDWGLDQDDNDKTQITYDDSATYHFKNPDTKVNIQYNFRLAEITGRDEVLDAMNGAKVVSTISAPGEFLGRNGINASDNSTIRITDDKVSGSNYFDIQRALGRSFSGDNDQITGQISWTRTAGTSASIVSNGMKGTVTSDESSQSFAADGAASDYMYVKVDDPNGGATRYYKVSQQAEKKEYTDEWDQTWRWTESAKYDYSGTFGTKDMQEQSAYATETYRKSVHYRQAMTTTCTAYTTTEISETDWNTLTASGTSALARDAGSGMSSAETAIWNNTQGGKYQTGFSTTGAAAVPSYTGNTTDLYRESDKQFVGVSATHNLTFKTKGNTGELQEDIFSFSHQIVGDGTGGSAAVTWQAQGKAKVDFSVVDPAKKTSEWDFNKIRLNVPMKRLDIQSGSEMHDQIPMEWSPLNLSIIGMSGTNTRTQVAAQSAIDDAKYALNLISETRMRFGTYQNRFEHAIRMTDNVVENTQRAESEIRDTNMADEMVRFSNASIIQQAGQSMLAQANQSKQGIISFLQ